MQMTTTDNGQVDAAAAKALYQQFNIQTGALAVLTQHAEAVLARCEAYPACDPLHEVLEHLRAELVEASQRMAAIRAAVDRFWPQASTDATDPGRSPVTVGIARSDWAA